MKNILLKEKSERKTSTSLAGIIRTCLLLIIFQVLCVTAYGQTGERISLKMNNATVEEVFNRIEKESGYRFLYSRNVVDVTRRVSITANRESIGSVLGKLFANTDIAYEIKDNKIVLSKKAAQAPGPDAAILNIKGKVTDEMGSAMPGVVVLVEGTSHGAVCDDSGNFEIKAPAGSTLNVSFIGYATQKIPVTKASSLEIKMLSDTQLMDEVVVVGYGTVSRKNLTTAVSTIKPSDVNKAAISNVSSLLLGRAAGLQATVASPQPDGRANISIRGGGAPIYVVDGIVMSGSSLEVGTATTRLPSSVDRSGLNGLNPSDIESIEVLKDASAAIYGIGASNGVILITTKKGRQGRPSVSYEGSYSFVRNLPYVDVLNAEQYMMVNNVFNRENYLYANSMYPYGDKAFDGRWSPIYSTEAIADNQHDTNWKKLVMKNGSITNHNVTINGGAEKFQYYLGLNYFDQDGTVINSGMKRYIIRSNTVVHIFPFLRLNTTLNYNNNQYKNSTVGADPGNGAHTYGSLQSALSYSPLLSVYDESGEYTRFKNIGNPVGLGNINDETRNNAFFANFTLDADIIKNMLTAKLVYGVNSENTKRSLYIPSNIYFNEMYRSRGNVGTAGRLKQTFEATVSFNHTFGDNIVKLDAIVGMGLYLENTEGLSTYYENTNDKIGNDKIDIAAGPFYPETYKTGNEKRSQFVRVSVDVLDRYVLTASLRRDGTDKFFPGQKYALFPSVSLAWKISNESFLRNVSWISLLKLRASYGMTGRDNLGASLYGLWKPSSYYVKFDDGTTQHVPFLMVGRDYDDVSWEKTVMKNIGLDFSVLKDRIWGSVDFYRYDETNLLSYDPESWMSMYGTRPVNGGRYKRQGFDIALNGKPIVKRDFEWEVSFNISRSKSLWIERQPNYQYQVWQVKENEPRNAYYYYKHTGIINIDRSNMPDSQRSLPASAQMPGYPILDDKNGDGVISEEDIYMDDDGMPKLYLGFGNTFKWKGFDLDIYMYGRFGIRRWNRGLAWGDWNQMTILSPKNVGTSVFDSFSSLTNPEGTRPGIAYSKGPSLPGGRGPDIDVIDASFLRVRNITLGYNVSTKQLGVVGRYINSIRVYFDMQNPFLFTKYPIFDPEVKDGGGLSTLSDYPQTRTFSLGAKIVF